MKRLIILLLLCSPAFALEKDFVLNADSISYEQDLVRAVGSVEANYDGVEMLGDEIEYNFKSDRGTGKNVKVIYDNVRIDGSKLDFDREEIKLTNSSFDTCGIRPTPHYHISARQISLYPKNKWLVAYWGIFWYQNIPTLPVPVYVYDIEAARKGELNTLPYPEIGSNDQDGFFINERVAWYLNRRMNGSFLMQYAAKKSLGGGLDFNYILNENNQGSVRTFMNFVEPPRLGLTHHYYFGKQLQSSYKPRDIFDSAAFKQLELETNVTYRERINYEYVSKLPELVLKIKQPDIKISTGVISDASSEGVAKVGVSANFSRPIFEKDGLVVTPILSLAYTRYSGGQDWTKNTIAVNLEKKWEIGMSGMVGFSHFINNDGQSPFAYERYRFVPYDQLYGGFKTKFGKSSFIFDIVYNMPNFRPQDIDYTLSAGVHCYSVGFKYRVMRNEVNLVFGII